MKISIKRVLAFVLTAALIFGLVPNLVQKANAANLNVGVEGLTVTSDSTIWTASDGQIQGTAKDNNVTVTLTLTNTSGVDATLSFNYNIKTANRASIGTLASDDGKINVSAATNPGTSGAYEETLEAGKSLVLTLKTAATGGASRNQQTLVISGIKMTSSKLVSVTFVPAENGSYTVGETAITENTTVEKQSTDVYSLNAAANDGYLFFGWYSNTDSDYVSYENPVSLKADSIDGKEITAVFVEDTNILFGVGNTKFTDLTAACNFAVSNGETTVVALNDGVLAGNYTIPAGVTLLIPFDSEHTVLTQGKDIGETFEKDGTTKKPNPYVTPYSYRTLTLAEGATITVNGSICVGGQHAHGSGSATCAAGAPSGPLGYIQMSNDSQIIVNNGANLYCWGYITGGGSVIAKNGATIHENFQFTDFRGGSATSTIATEFKVFPLSQYYVQNIEVALTLEYGAQESVATSIFMGGKTYSASVNFIGNGGMFVPGEGSKFIKRYDSSKDRLVLEVHGNAEINPMGLELGGTAINSSNFALPINGNIDILIRSGKTVLDQSIALLPGSSVTIDSGAELHVLAGEATNPDYPDSYVVGAFGDTVYETGHNMIVYDAETWGNYVYNNVPLHQLQYVAALNGAPVLRDQNSITDATILVNGTLTADGYIYTTTNDDFTIGANITSNGGGVIKFNSGVGEDVYTYQVVQNDTLHEYADILITNAMLHNADGSYVDTYSVYWDNYEDAGVAHYYQYVNGEWKLNYVAPTTGTVIFDANGGTAISAVTADIGSTITLPTAEGKAHYTFLGWDADGDGDVDYIGEASYTINGDVTLTAVWKINQYTITFETGDHATAIDPITKDANSKITLPEATRTGTDAAGYAFAGWATEANGAVVYRVGDELTLIGNVTLYPVWNKASFTITYMYGTTVLGTQTYQYGAAITPLVLSEDHYPEGMTFSSWSPAVPATMPAENLVVYATYATKTYTVKWYINGVLVETDTNVTHGSAASYDGSIPTKAADAEYHYEFAWWSSAADSTEEASNIVTGNVSFYAVFGETRHTPGEYSDNGDGTHDILCAHGDCDALYKASEPHNYVSGSCDCGALEPITVTIVTPATDTTEASTSTITKDYGTTVQLPAAPSWTGHTFLGYAESADGEVTIPVSKLEYRFTKNVTLYAVYKVNTYTLTVETLHNEITVEVPYGTKISELNEIKNLDIIINVNDMDDSDGDGWLEVGQYVFSGWAVGPDAMNLVGCDVAEFATLLMPASDFYVDVEYWFTGWENDGTGWTYCESNDYLYNDEIGEVDGELYFFDENGYIVANKGLVRVVTEEGVVEYYYFGCSATDKDSHADNSCNPYKAQKNCAHWVENNNGYLVKWDYTFDANGVIVHHADTSRNGVYADEEGVDCYYIDGVKVHKGLFVGEDGHYYYARSNGSLVKGRTYWVSVTNGLLEKEGSYYFNERGQLVIPEDKNGFVKEADGNTYYYVDNVRTYAGVLAGNGTNAGELGSYYYVNTNGMVIMSRRYWISKDNGVMKNGWYEIDETGKIQLTNGFVKEADGNTYYYVNGLKTYAGVLAGNGTDAGELGSYYYVNTNGMVIMNRTYWISKDNGIVKSGWYEIDETGKIQLTNGFVKEADGNTYYYVNGLKTYAGLIEIDGYYYYVNTDCKVIMGRTYWISKTNGIMKQGWFEFDEQGRMIIK